MDFTNEQVAEIVKLYYQFNSPTLVIQTINKRYPEYKRLNRWKLHWVIRNFEARGTVEDQRKFKSGRSKASRTSKNISKVRDIVDETPTKSLSDITVNINKNNTEISRSSVYRMLKYDLKLLFFSYSLDNRCFGFSPWILRGKIWNFYRILN